MGRGVDAMLVQYFLGVMKLLECKRTTILYVRVYKSGTFWFH